MPDQATAHARTTGLVTNWTNDGIAYWCVALPSDPRVIGFAGVEIHKWLDRDVFNLYYRLTPTEWGKGYATEAAIEGVKAAAVVRPDLPIVARSRSSNLASIRVAEKVGLNRRVDLEQADGEANRVVYVSRW